MRLSYFFRPFEKEYAFPSVAYFRQRNTPDNGMTTPRPPLLFASPYYTQVQMKTPPVTQRRPPCPQEGRSLLKSEGE